MLNRTPKPMIFLAFANDRQADGVYLRNLGQEAEQLREVLANAEQANLCQVEVITSTSAENILKRFSDPVWKGRIAIFHYAGHAQDNDLLLESVSGERTIADGRGLAAFLRQQRGLQLVLLNACSTRAQVEDLLDAGIAAVIATSRAIDDEIATDFARHFYTALASGDNIRTSFEKAQAALQFVHSDLSRHLRPVQNPLAEHTAAGWPWALYLRKGMEERATWDLPSAANDPLFGLPPLPEMDLPAKPFRDLSWFRRTDAPIFFGRGQQIRQLYTVVTETKTAPIVLFYGQSGVGKSSLLDAGLLPRLEQVHRVVYLRRDQEQGLLKTLLTNLAGSENISRQVLDAWHTAEQQANKPLTLILDQMEEHFTRPNPALPDEMPQFLDALGTLFADRSQRPQGKLILSFRKEWLAEIEKRLSECALPFSKLFLERLDQAGVIEAVGCVAWTPALQQHYGLTLEEDLADEIAHDLLKDREAPIAPMLQILLTRLWEEATQRDRASPHFDRALYDQLRREGLKLSEFLDRQLARLKEQQPEVVDSGLALDLLSFHTTPLGTAEQRDFAVLQTEYQHRAAILPELVRNFQSLYLLVDPAADQVDAAQKSRLAHDTLAPLVRVRFDESDLPGQRARRILETRAMDWDDGVQGMPLERSDLRTVELGMMGMRNRTLDEQRLCHASQTYIARQNLIRRLIFLSFGALITVLLIIWQFDLIRNLYLRWQAAKNTPMVIADHLSVDQYEVSKNFYQMCVKAKHCEPSADGIVLTNDQHGNYPVTHVTALNAQTYCQWLEKRLPSSAEWDRIVRIVYRLPPDGELEYDPTQFNLGTDEPESVISLKNDDSSIPIGMIGNVWEWTYTLAQDQAVKLNDAETAPWDGTDATVVLFVRGGAFSTPARVYTLEQLQMAAPVTHHDHTIGFRCVSG